MAMTAPIVRGLDGPRALRVAPEHPRGAAAASPIAITCRSRPSTSPTPRPACSCASHAASPMREIPRASWRFADPTHIELDGGFAPGGDLRPRLSLEGPRGHRLRLPHRARHGGVASRARRGGRQPVRGRARTARTRSACPSPGASSATSSTWRSTRTSRGGASSTRSCRTWPARGAASSTCGSASRRSTRGSRWAACSRSPTSSRPIRLTGQRGALLAPPGAARRPAEDLHDQHVRRVLARRRLAGPHRRRGARRTSRRRRRCACISSPGTQHTPDALPPPAEDPNTGGRGLQRFNVVDYAPLLRAALVNLDQWVREGGRAAAERGAAHGRSARRCRTRRSRRSSPRFPASASPTASSARSDSTSERSGRAGSAPTLPPKIGAPFATRRLRGRRRRQRGRGHPARRAAVPLGDLHRLESTAPGAGGARRHHVDDGLDAAVPRARPTSARSAAIHAPRSPSGTPRATTTSRACAPRREALVRARHMLAEDVDAVVARAATQWDLFQAGL